jgi:hypothetical protein
VSATESKPQSSLSSWDKEVLEMADCLDPGQLMMEGEILTELEIHEVLSITVRSLKKADWTEINKDVNEFRRGIEAEVENAQGEKTKKLIVPFPDEILEFSNQRRLAQGLVGLNGYAYPDHWGSRVQMLEQLPEPAYAAIFREYTKFLQAVGTLFPDQATKEHYEKLKIQLGKAQAHH